MRHRLPFLPLSICLLLPVLGQPLAQQVASAGEENLLAGIGLAESSERVGDNELPDISSPEMTRAARLAEQPGRAVRAAEEAGPPPPLRWRDYAFRMPDLEYAVSIYEGDEELKAALADGRAQPTALASGDFDEDGVTDLVCGYAVPSGGLIALHRGSRDAIYSNSPVAQRHRREGTFNDGPYFEVAHLFASPASPDFIAVGDFDNDGHLDVALASAGATRLNLLRGDGRGGLASTTEVALGGAITAMVAGEINRADGLTDLVVAIERTGSPALLVFEGPGGALQAEPEEIPIPATANGLALGELDDDRVGRDLAVAAGREVVLVYGRNRWLTLGQDRRAAVPPPTIQRIALPAIARDLAVGDYLWETNHRSELAVLLVDGSVRLLLREGVDQPTWTAVTEVALSTVTAPGHNPLLLTARVTGRPTQDLLLLDPGSRRLTVLGGVRRADAHEFGEHSDHIGVGDTPVAVLPSRLDRDAIDDLVFLTRGMAGPAFARLTNRATFTVRHKGDGADEFAGDGVCSTTAGDPATCTLRAAIEETNALAGPDTIEFDLDPASLTITPQSPLPTALEPLTIDGTSQAGYAGTPIVELEGTMAGTGDGLSIAGGSSVVRGLVIRNFPSSGIQLQAPGGNIVENNFIGTDLLGSLDQGNTGFGVDIVGSPSNTVGGTVEQARNLLSGNDIYGVAIRESGATGNLILGNLIGTDWSGALSLGNSLDGVAIYDDATQNTVGGTTAGARNIISGNGRGISFWNGSANDVLGNYIGTDISGTSPLGNELRAILFGSDEADGLSHDNLIGSTAVGAGNVISATVTNSNIDITEGSWNNQLLGNLIGTDRTGTVAMGSLVYDGVTIGDSPNNIIGGVVPGAGNLLSGNADTGVYIFQPGATGNRVLGNLIGTDISGTLALGNARYGVCLLGVSENAVLNNVISANGRHGVIVWGDGASENRIQGNLIGTDASGTVALGNVLRGVNMQDHATGTLVGGTDPGEQNVISGNGWQGVYLSSALPDNDIVGNRIGTDITGTIALGNGGPGILLIGQYGGAQDNEVTGNLISGNQEEGIALVNGADRNLLLGNRIGTDASGMAALGNHLSGVFLEDSSENKIGDTADGAGNLISGGYGDGVVIVGGLSRNNRIVGNLIGTDATGAPTLGNSGSGVMIFEGPYNTIGGTTVGAANRIAGNANAGVVILGTPANANPILGNSIFANGLLGIDLNWPDGVTPNDPGDLDTGPNNVQNYPTLTLAEATPSGLTVSGTLNSRPGLDYRLEFYGNSSSDDSGHGEGETLLGSQIVTTDESGNVSFSVSTLAGVSNGDAIAATATSRVFNTLQDTSEFSLCLEASCLSLAVFGETVLAQDPDTWSWAAPQDIRYAKGNLLDVGTYSLTDDGTAFGVTSLDMSMDQPAGGGGLYYLIRSISCGSWQTDLGAQPNRDAAMP